MLFKNLIKIKFFSAICLFRLDLNIIFSVKIGEFIMVKLKGKGAFTAQSLIVTLPKNGEYHQDKDPKKPVIGYFADVQVDQTLKNVQHVRDGKSEAQTDPHLVSSRVQYKDKNGDKKFTTNHRLFYSKSQVDKMMAAASDVKKGTKPKIQEYDGATVLGIKGDLTPTNKGLVVNTSKPMSPTGNYTFGKNILERQNAVTKAAQAHENDVYQAQKAAGKTQDAVKNVEAPEKSADASKQADGPEA